MTALKPDYNQLDLAHSKHNRQQRAWILQKTQKDLYFYEKSYPALVRIRRYMIVFLYKQPN